METTDSPGSVVGGRYVLLELAGRGGMAEVWRAEQQGAEGFRRVVAVKRIHPHLAASSQYRALFVREAQVNAALDHPNVVQVLDFGQDGGGLYIAMEWVEGLTMRDIASLCRAFRVQTSPVLVAAIGIEVLRALEAAHGHMVRSAHGVQHRPIFHRDLAPSNVLLSVRGVVKLATLVSRARWMARDSHPRARSWARWTTWRPRWPRGDLPVCSRICTAAVP